MPRKAPPASPSLPDLECACATARRVARLLTQLYSQEMGRKLEPSQFALLTALSCMPGASQAPLGRALGLDKTTLSRNLRLLEKNGWIEPAPHEDQRERGFRLTRNGEKILIAARPGWLRAQNRLRSVMKAGEWENMMKVFGLTAKAALDARKQS